MNSKALTYILVTGFFFGTSLVAGRFALGQFEPIVYVSLRLFLSSLGFLAVYALASKRYPWPRRGPIWRHSLVLGLSTVVAMICFTTSLLFLSSGLTSIIATAGPALTVVMAHYVLTDERLTVQKIAGVALAIGGALLLILRGESGLANVEASSTGYLLLLTAIIAIAGNTVYIRRYTQGMNPFQVTSIQVFAASLLTLPLSLWLIGINWDLVTWEGLVALGYGSFIGTFLGFLLFLYIAQAFGATAAAMTNYVNPVFATLAGVVVLHETITWGMVAGMLVIVAGVWLANRPSGTAVKAH